ncbi:MAG: PEP-CTERM sorting domain-containing protein, partial [Deltaproteobacteria bacterium]|nr:PEP-CTERM sorting domain-containing protein [Deltaproteobacteria bacterium]
QNVVGIGTYNFYGGTLNNSLIVGDAGTGLFANSGGTHNVTGDMILGNQATGLGTYNLSGTGSVAVSGNTIVGMDGTGYFNQSGGTHTTGSLVLGQNTGSFGMYNFTGGVLNDSIIVGDAGTGVFNNSGGTHNVTGDMILGNQATGVGTYNLSGTGSVVVSGSTIVGAFGTGVFNQSGGGNAITDNLVLGDQATGSGAYNLSAGALSANDLHIGENGSGVFTQSGGSNAIASELFIGRNTGSSGSYDLSGGTLSVGWAERVGVLGTATFNQTGGTNQTSELRIGGSGTYNYSGGALTATGGITNDGAFNQSGATTVNANVVNNNAYNISGPGTNTVAGDFFNSATGTVKTTATTAVFTGTFTNLGAYVSDPSNNYFNNLIIQTTGYLHGGTGDNFFIADNFYNNSAQNTSWNTAMSLLSFTNGMDTSHDYYLTGVDFGASVAGFTNNYAWGTLQLDAGNNLNIYGTALYLDMVVLGSGTALNLNGVHVYYNTLVNNGGSWALLNGGTFTQIASAQVPEPTTLLLLAIGFGGLLAARKRLFNGQRP